MSCTTEELRIVQHLPGKRLRIRPLAPGETDVLQDVFDGMSVWSRYQRYHTAMPRLSAANRAALGAVDGRRRVALVAERIGPHGWRAEGLAHLIAVGQSRAEVAVEVVDAAQGQGVGRTLLQQLVAVAEVLEYRWIEASVMSSNIAMLRLLGRLFPDASSTVEDGTVNVEIHLGRLPSAQEAASSGWSGGTAVAARPGAGSPARG